MKKHLILFLMLFGVVAQAAPQTNPQYNSITVTGTGGTGSMTISTGSASGNNPTINGVQLGLQNLFPANSITGVDGDSIGAEIQGLIASLSPFSSGTVAAFATGGANIDTVKARFAADITTMTGGTYSTRAFIQQIGANDISRIAAGTITTGSWETTYSSLTGSMTAAGVPVYVSTLLYQGSGTASTLFNAITGTLNTYIRSLARPSNSGSAAVYVMDYNLVNPPLGDAVHPSDAGVSLSYYTAQQFLTGRMPVYQTDPYDLVVKTISPTGIGSILIGGTNAYGDTGGQQLVPTRIWSTYTGTGGSQPSFFSNVDIEAFKTGTFTQSTNQFAATFVTWNMAGSQTGTEAAIDLAGGSQSTGTTSNYVGALFESPYAGTSLVTNAYGIYVNPMKGTGVTNGYGVYHTGTADQNLLSGVTVIDGTLSLKSLAGNFAGFIFSGSNTLTIQANGNSATYPIIFTGSNNGNAQPDISGAFDGAFSLGLVHYVTQIRTANIGFPVAGAAISYFSAGDYSIFANNDQIFQPNTIAGQNGNYVVFDGNISGTYASGTLTVLAPTISITYALSASGTGVNSGTFQTTDLFLVQPSSNFPEGAQASAVYLSGTQVVVRFQLSGTAAVVIPSGTLKLQSFP